MDLEHVRVINCFGFADTSVNLTPRLVYVLGRNSSGKTSLLDSINHLSPVRVPQDHPRFANFQPTETNSQIAGRFRVSKAPALDAGTALGAIFKARNIPDHITTDHKQFQATKAELVTLYAALSTQIEEQGYFTLTKFASGRCQLTAGEQLNAAGDRRKSTDSLLSQLVPNGTFTSGSSNYPGTRLISADLDREVAARVTPPIFYYSDSYNLTEDIPDHLTSAIVSHPPNNVTRAFAKLLDAEDLEDLLTTNDPDDQDRLRDAIQRRANELAERITKDSARLVEITLSPTSQGVQVTMRTDRKKSFYRQMSDATKFLVAFHIHAYDHRPGGVLLFDEPSRGLHSTAEQYVRGFLERLSDSNHVVVSTHSKYLLDVDHLDRIRLMQQDKNNRLDVLNSLRPPRERQNYLLALQPVFDAIGVSHAQQVLTNAKVVLTEGLTDYLYIRAFQRLLTVSPDFQLTPGRGEGSLLTLIPFMISQGINLKVILDGVGIKPQLQDAFGIPDTTIFVVSLDSNRTTGIEDVFAALDYQRILKRAGYDVADKELAKGNSTYAKRTNKRLVAQTFLNEIDSYELAAFEEFTRHHVEAILNFCNNDDWWRLP
jgi:energy-coupling factor transporter ATP-binding protein EcfA2